MNLSPPPKIRIRALLGALAVSILGPVPAALADAKIGALGTIVPESGITVLTAGEVIEKILVRPGEEVKAGSVLVVFRGQQAAAAAVSHAKSVLQSARADAPLAVHLQELKVKQSDIDLGFARERLQNLNKMDAGSVSPQLVEQRQYQVSVAEMTLDSAKTQLQRVEAEAADQIRAAENQLSQDVARLDQTTLVAPLDGTILDMSGHVGEPAGGQQVVRMANLRAMAVSAEVFASDVLKVAPGQKATVSSPSLPNEISGSVLSVSRLITGRSKIAQVLIRLSDPAVAARMIGLEVNVTIEP
ncbi:MAG TPA: efflux RND transporter periplasmic adaptor subunit [Opitutaceae bacterium]|nr:efflux RND transporter periplasmic adaptor subunit [Opitutaceae bacterium]